MVVLDRSVTNGVSAVPAGARTATGDRRRLLVAGLVLAFVLGGCGSPSRQSTPRRRPTSTAKTTVSVAATTTTTTIPGVQTSGPRTILSPIGLNVRAQPLKTAAVLGTAAQGVVLEVLGHTDAAGGWFQVKGATVTGWISDSPTFSAPGKFSGYVSSVHQFDALYPVGWKVVESPPTSVTFSAPSGGETVVVTTATKVGQLGQGRPGYSLSKSEQILICGATTYLDIYAQAAPSATTAPGSTLATPEPYLVQAQLTLDAQHALGIDANLANLSQLQTVLDFVDSISFAFPPCQG